MTKGEGSRRQAGVTQLRYKGLDIPESAPTRTGFVLAEVKKNAPVIQLDQKSIVESLRNYRAHNDSATWEKFVASMKHIAKNDAKKLAADKIDSADGLEEFIFEFSKVLRGAGHFNLIPALNDFAKTRLIYSQVLAIQDGFQEVEKAKAVSQEALYANVKEIHERLNITPDEYEALDMNLKGTLIQGLRIYTREFWAQYEESAIKKAAKMA